MARPVDETVALSEGSPDLNLLPLADSEVGAKLSRIAALAAPALLYLEV